MKSSVSQVLGVQGLLVGKESHSLSCKNCEIRGGNNPKCNTKVSEAIGKIFLTCCCVVRLWLEGGGVGEGEVAAV